MFDALLARASTRFVFVVGKGGVGKTTTAGALALGFADQSQPTHLISTDPAHSVQDLFQHQNCSNALTIEEFDARKYADDFFREIRAPFAELIERGSYLDSKDAASFLDLSIPGIDEVMSAFRLVELLDGDVRHVVIDTAPTGHAIRLLDAANVIESWIEAARAMAEKAGVVASALVGRPFRMKAEEHLDQWQRAVRRYRNDVLRQASAIVVTRAGDVVEAETLRLIDELKERGINTAAVVSVGRTSAAADFTVRRFANASGCDGLRQWRKQVVTSDVRTTVAPASLFASPPPHTRAEPWLRQQHAKYVWFAGKGGVGKSTCASAMATLLAESRKICIVSTDPAGSLSEVFGKTITSQPQEIVPGLFAQQIDAVSEFERMRAQYRNSVNDVFASLGLDAAAQLDRRVVESLWDFAPPGIDEIISLIEIVEQGGDYETLIIDSAPTGHFLRLIEMPEIALDWVHSLMRLIVKYGAVTSLDAVARELLAFAKRLRQLQTDLSTPGTTAVFVVTLAEAMVIAETARLSSSLGRAGVPEAALIVNRADEGLRDVPSGLKAGRWIRAPEATAEIVGPAALRQFIAQWEIHGE